MATPRRFLAVISGAPVYQESSDTSSPIYHTLGAMMDMMRDSVATVHSLSVKNLRIVADKKGEVSLFAITTGGEPRNPGAAA